MKEIIRKNWIFIMLVIIGIVCFLGKDNVLPMEIVPKADSTIQFSKADGILEQTWLSEVKEIAGVCFMVKAEEEIDAQFTLRVLDGKTSDVLAFSTQKIAMEKGMEQEILFSFNKIKACLGKQIVFQLCFDESIIGNTILLSSGTNYMGCTIKGIEIGEGAAFKVMFVKNSLMWWLLCSFFPFISFTFLFMVVWKKKWEECIGVSTAAVIFLMFFVGLFDKLTWGIGLVYLMSTAAFAAGVILYNKKNRKLSELGSWGLVIYGVMVLLILINCSGARYARWDEFSHWGLAAKDMFYSDSFAKHFGSAVMMQYYPPVMTLMEYFFCYTNKLFSMGATYVGFQILCLNLLSSGLGICKNRKVISYVPVIFSLLLVPLVFFQDVYNSLYTDPILAFGVAYVLICYYTSEWDKFNFLRILGGLFLLTLTKDSGVVLAGLLTLVMLGTCIYRQYAKKRYDFKKIGGHIFLTAWVCVLFFTWQYYLSIPMEKSTDYRVEMSENNSEVQEESIAVTGAIGHSGITLGGIVELCTGKAPAYRHTAIKKFVSKFFSEDSYYLGPISFSYMDLAVVILCLFFFMAEYSSKEKKEDIGVLGVLLFIAGLGYAGFLLITYLFAFSVSEAVTMTSLGRYLASYICGILIASLIILMKETASLSKKMEQRIYLLVSAIVLIITPVEFFIIKNEDTELTDDYVYGYDDLTMILQTGAKGGDKVYFVCNNTNGCAELQFKTSAVPLLSDYKTANLFASKEKYLEQMELYEATGQKGDGSPYVISAVEWAKILDDYQYVVLFSINDVFKDSYSTLFEESDTIGNGSVYRVCLNNKAENKLEYVGSTGIKNFK